MFNQQCITFCSSDSVEMV